MRGGQERKPLVQEDGAGADGWHLQPRLVYRRPNGQDIQLGRINDHELDTVIAQPGRLGQLLLEGAGEQGHRRLHLDLRCRDRCADLHADSPHRSTTTLTGRPSNPSTAGGRAATVTRLCGTLSRLVRFSM